MKTKTIEKSIKQKVSSLKRSRKSTDLYTDHEKKERHKKQE